MNAELQSIRDHLVAALFSGTDLADFNQITLTSVYHNLVWYLTNPAVSSQLKLDFALKVFPELVGIMAIPLWRKYLSVVGHAGNLRSIYREFHYHTQSLVNQEEYEAAIKKIPSSKFPPCLRDLPNFFKMSLLDELERLVKLS